MVSDSIYQNSSTDLTRAITLLNDVVHALEENDFIDEASLVADHLRQLSAPDVQSRILDLGIDPVLSEFAQEFSSNTVTS